MGMESSKSPASLGHSDLSFGPADFLLSEPLPMVMVPLPVQAGHGSGPAGRDTSDGTQERRAEAAGPAGNDRWRRNRTAGFTAPTQRHTPYLPAAEARRPPPLKSSWYTSHTAREHTGQVHQGTGSVLRTQSSAPILFSDNPVIIRGGENLRQGQCISFLVTWTDVRRSI